MREVAFVSVLCIFIVNDEMVSILDNGYNSKN